MSDENAADVAMFKFLLINLLCTILLEKGTSSGQFLLKYCDKQNDAMVAKLNKMNGKQCPPGTCLWDYGPSITLFFIIQ